MPTIKKVIEAQITKSIKSLKASIKEEQRLLTKYRACDEAWLDVEVPETATVAPQVWPTLNVPYDHVQNDEIVGRLYEILGVPEVSRDTTEGTSVYELGAYVKWRIENGKFHYLDIRFQPNLPQAACKLVKSGTKTVEQTVYKIECGESD